MGKASQALSPGVVGVGWVIGYCSVPCTWVTRSRCVAYELLARSHVCSAVTAILAIAPSPCRAGSRVVLRVLLESLWASPWPSHPGESLAVSFPHSYSPPLSHTERRRRTRELPMVSPAWGPSWALCSWRGRPSALWC